MYLSLILDVYVTYVWLSQFHTTSCSCCCPALYSRCFSLFCFLVAIQCVEIGPKLNINFGDVKRWVLKPLKYDQRSQMFIHRSQNVL